MELRKVIEKRRAYRSLKPCKIDEELVKELAECASLAPSCYNNQPWRFVFVYKKEILEKLFEALPEKNSWAKTSSLVIAVFSEKHLDCITANREYYLFDTGMATAFLILRATDLGLVAHPIAGFDEQKVKEVLKIPEEMTIITLVIIGEKSEELNTSLTEKQADSEDKRPGRLKFDKFCSIDSYENKVDI